MKLGNFGAMIQRKQTLFLLAVTIIAIILFFIPFQSFTLSGQNGVQTLMPGCNSQNMNGNIYFPMSLNGLVIILSIATIFLFKNRVLQYKLANGLLLLNVFIIGLLFLLDVYKTVPETHNYTIGAFLPVIGAAFAFLAAFFIKKDEQLVRSADRIR